MCNNVLLIQLCRNFRFVLSSLIPHIIYIYICIRCFPYTRGDNDHYELGLDDGQRKVKPIGCFRQPLNCTEMSDDVAVMISDDGTWWAVQIKQNKAATISSDILAMISYDTLTPDKVY